MTMKTTKRLKATTALASTTTPIVNAPTGNIVYCLCVCVCVCALVRLKMFIYFATTANNDIMKCCFFIVFVAHIEIFTQEWKQPSPVGALTPQKTGDICISKWQEGGDRCWRGGHGGKRGH